MHMRAKLYWRYLKRRLDAADAKMNEQVCFPSFCVVQVVNAGIQKKEAENEDIPENEKEEFEEKKAREKEIRDRKLDNLLNRSLLGTRMQVFTCFFIEQFIIPILQLLIISFFFFSYETLQCYFSLQELLGRYILMEQYYMKESVSKAMIMEQKDPDSLTRF